MLKNDLRATWCGDVTLKSTKSSLISKRYKPEESKIAEASQILMQFASYKFINHFK